MNAAKYRADIDGLRAIAVLAVVLYHLNPGIVPGGYTGVDIFFVISGYLVTSQIRDDLLRGRFSVGQFYKRRVSRILPALAVMLSFAGVAGMLLLTPSELMRFATSAFLAMVGLANIYLWQQYGNYFAGNAEEATLLHTWSLGVEEQFYALWPLVLMLLYRKFPRRMLPATVALAVAGIALSEIAARQVASASYYLLPTRAFELLFGAILSLAGALRIEPGWKLRGCTALGYGLIAYSLFGLDRASMFPGVNAVYPSLGTMLLIAAGGSGQASRVLTNPASVLIGKISYSLYLWHWPLLAYLAYFDVALGVTGKTAVFALSILLAWLSWKYVEVPFRTNGAALTVRRTLLTRFAIPASACGMACVLTLAFHGFPQRYPEETARLEQMAEAKPDIVRRGCHVPNTLYDTPPSTQCRLGVEKAEFDGILIGDSFANHYSGLVDVMARESKLSIMDYTMDGCPPIRGYVKARNPAYAERCRIRIQNAFQMLQERRFRLVILGASWPREAQSGEAVLRTLRELLEGGAEVVVLMDNQPIRRAVGCVVRAAAFGSGEDCEVEESARPAYWERVRRELPEVRFIDPNEVICPNGTCRPVLDGVLLYRDDSHLNEVGSRLIGRLLARTGEALVPEPFRGGAVHDR